MTYDTAGDPISGLKWTRKTTEKIACELKNIGIQVSQNTVARLLKEMDFSLRVNHKKLASNSCPDRDEQFSYIAQQRENFSNSGDPIISVDTKKKELVGNFKNQGRTYCRKPIEVNDHDFRSTAVGMAAPYGIYDVQRNQGSVFVGVSSDTPEFAVNNIEKWWRYSGYRRYPNSKNLLILADGGGSNAARSRVWKLGIQKQLCDRHDLTVTVCHYPTGTSKWNPIEHRLFAEISKNWAGRPLDSFDTILNYIRTTTTSAGLTTKAYLVRKQYQKGQRVSDQDFKALALRPHGTQPIRNYSLSPR